MKNTKIAAMILSGAILLSGCSLADKNNAYLKHEMPMKSYEQKYDEDSGDTTIDLNGRTYSYFGRINERMNQNSIRECLGYVDGDKNWRIYGLADDPYDNYIMIKHVKGIMDQPVFLRATDTRQKDIFTPKYIASAGYECWASSGIHYEMPAAGISFICNVENAREVGYTYKINGKEAGGGVVAFASGKKISKGEKFTIEITEVQLGDYAEKDKPFMVEITFSVKDMDGETHEVNGSYKQEMMLGAAVNNLELRLSDDGYCLFEDK